MFWYFFRDLYTRDQQTALVAETYQEGFDTLEMDKITEGAKTSFFIMFSNIWPLARPNIANEGSGVLKTY